MTNPTSLFTGLDIDQTTGDAVAQTVGLGLRRAGALAETVSRSDSTIVAETLTTTQGYFTAIEIGAGTKVSKLTFFGVGASSAITHQWAALYGSKSSGATGILGISADGTSTATSATSEIGYTLTTPYTVQTDGLFYVCLSLTGSGLPTIAGVTGTATLSVLAQPTGFTDSTTVLGIPSTAAVTPVVSAGAPMLYCWIS